VTKCRRRWWHAVRLWRWDAPATSPRP